MKRGNRDLRKRQFVNVMKNTIGDCLDIFGYTKEPYIFETRFDDNTMMLFVEGAHGESAIYYDYQRFQRVFAKCTDEHRIYRLMHIVAHEMRHYYQYRQIKAKKPREDAAVVEEWKKEKVIRHRGKNNEYFGNVRELDANTFAYIYMAERCKVILSDCGIPENYRIRMRNYAQKVYGESHFIFGSRYSEHFS